MTKPLAAFRVVDITRFVSGSYAAALLGALGAEILKVETPAGDPYRGQGLGPSDEGSALFFSLNAGKRSVVIDFLVPKGRAVLDQLLGTADFFIENSRPGSLARHGLDFEAMHARHPWLVYGSVTGYGPTGPDAERGGFDLILQADTGIMSMTGSAASGPVKIGAPVLDIGAGLSCALGMLAAHISRLESRVGIHASSSLFEFALAALGTVTAEYLSSQLVPGLLGTHSPMFAPYGGFRTADDWIVLAGAGSEELWRRACEVLGREDLADDPRFSDNRRRVHHRDELTAELEAVLVQAPTSHWLTRLEAAGIPVATVKSLDEVVTGPQATALGVLQYIEDATGETHGIVAPPLRIGDTLPSFAGPAPGLGEATRSVLADLGYSAEAIDTLVDDEVVIAP